MGGEREWEEKGGSKGGQIQAVDPTACILVGVHVQDSTASIAVQGKEGRMRKGGGGGSRAMNDSI